VPVSHIGPGLAIVAQLAVASAPGAYWFEVTPANDAQRELYRVATDRSQNADSRTTALQQLSVDHPGTLTSGLAQLAAGLTLLESQAPLAEITTALTHPDIGLTQLSEHALLGQAHALVWADQHAAAARAFSSALERRPSGPSACSALAGAATAFASADDAATAIKTWNRSLRDCTRGRPHVLLSMAMLLDELGQSEEAAAAYDRLDREHPASSEARRGEARLSALATHLPRTSPAERALRDHRKAMALARGGRHVDAARMLASLLPNVHLTSSHDAMCIALARSELARGRFPSAENALARLPKDSEYIPEAAYLLAGIAARKGSAVAAYESVAERFPGTRWAQEALFSLANHFQKDALDERALPYYRRLYQEYPQGSFLERAAWRVGWGDYRAGRYADAAETFQSVARSRAASPSAGIFLFWAGRAGLELEQTELAHKLLKDAVHAFKHTYHGQQAEQVLRRDGVAPDEMISSTIPPPQIEIVEPHRTRLSQLLLIGLYDAAAAELRLLPANAGIDSTLAWVEAHAQRYPESIRAATRAYPYYSGAIGDRLPDDVWRLLFPLGYSEALLTAARKESLDPALVAALIHQESHFDRAAVSSSGARGLMQVMPDTARGLARQVGLRYRESLLSEPIPSLQLGTRYLRQMLDRFGGQEERALAAYNAGPHRVEAWEAIHPGMSREVFVESIPFTQTRLYVRKVLSNQQQYQRLYAFGSPQPDRDGVAEQH